MRPPRFDFWFWALVVWSFVVPYLFDLGHVRSCDDRGVVTFDLLIERHTFTCARSSP